MQKAHQVLFSGTVEELCPVTLRLTNLVERMCCGDEKEVVAV